MNLPEEQVPAPGQLSSGIEPEATEPFYPPKWQPADKTAGIWLRSLLSLTFYLILGFYFFRRWELLLLITGIVLLHELGHFVAMKAFRYNDLGIFFIPLLGAYVSGSKREVSQRESAIILLAGPLPGILLGIGVYLLAQQNPLLSLGSIPLYTVSVLLVLLNLINLFPIYPLDGGQLLNRVLLDEHHWLSRAFIILSAAFLTWFAWQSRFPVLFIFPVMLLLRLFGENKLSHIEKKIEEAGIQTDVDYAHLPDRDYWAIRKILIEEHPSFRNEMAGPPYAYSDREEKIMEMVQSLLHRSLIQDLSLTGKFLVLLIWTGGIAAPWLINMDMSFLQRFGF